MECGVNDAALAVFGKGAMMVAANKSAGSGYAGSQSADCVGALQMIACKPGSVSSEASPRSEMSLSPRDFGLKCGRVWESERFGYVNPRRVC